LNGIIVVNKPTDFTSFDVCAKMRGILKTRKIGHTGTLDPIATGVLPILVGNATKLCNIMPDKNKSYRAGFKLGAKTDTQDITGKITENYDKRISREEICEKLLDFRGEIEQIPPMYSAVSVGGKRLYELARQGKVVERPSRKVTIYEITLESFNEEAQSGEISVSCSEGTYIRTIINDIGESLECGGYLTSLVRTKACGFDISETVTLEELENLRDNNNLDSVIIPVERVFSYLDRINLSQKQTQMYKNGVKLYLKNIKQIKENVDEYAVYGYDGEFIGTAIADSEEEILRIGKNFFQKV
jgi:tRNA pseudouridine55 synthase